jgi:DNA-binding MarR family transcriptional regulator
MALKGNIETFYLSSILQLLAQDKKTGILTIAEKGRMVRVYIKNGNIVYAVGTQKEVRLGYLLRTKGIISAEELQKALTLAKQRNEKLGKILVEKGFISVETLKKFIHQQVRDILYDLFLWKRGDFEYTDQEFSLDQEFVTELNHMEVILEGTRRVDEWEILRKNIPEPQMVFKINRSVEEKRDTINLTANEWRIISLVDGSRTVQQIIEDSGNDEFSVYRVINSLISSGLIEPGARMAAIPSEDKSEAPAIIQVYHLVLLSILKMMEKAVGNQAHNLLEEAKARVPSQYAKLLQSFDHRGDAKKNVKALIEAAANTAPSNQELVNAFNAWILAILHKQNEILDADTIAAGIKEVTKPDAAWQKFPGKSDIKGAILSAIIQTVEQFQREVERSAKDKAKTSGILSFLKRK